MPKSSYLIYLILADTDHLNTAEDMHEVAPVDASLTPPHRDNPLKKGIGASLIFYEFKDGSFIDITEPGRLSGRIPEFP